MLKPLLASASFANICGGLVLMITWVAMWEHVPPVVVLIGGALFIQGLYTTLYLHGDLEPWGDFATGALFAGECLAACVGAGGLVEAVIHNMNNSDMEMAPVLAGLLMLTQAALALLYLVFSDKVRPRLDETTSA